jgi:capsule polysaccharide modification protein KpsS
MFNRFTVFATMYFNPSKRSSLLEPCGASRTPSRRRSKNSIPFRSFALQRNLGDFLNRRAYHDRRHHRISKLGRQERVAVLRSVSANLAE